MNPGEISGSHDDACEDDCLLGYYAMQSGINLLGKET
jgi:hypothetical protein